MGTQKGNPSRGEDSATWGPRIEGGLEPGIAEQQGDEAVLSVSSMWHREAHEDCNAARIGRTRNTVIPVPVKRYYGIYLLADLLADRGVDDLTDAHALRGGPRLEVTPQ